MVIGLHVVGAVLGIAVLVWSVWPLHRRLWFDTHSNRSAMGGLLDQIDDPARDLLRLTRAIKRGKAPLWITGSVDRLTRFAFRRLRRKGRRQGHGRNPFFS